MSNNNNNHRIGPASKALSAYMARDTLIDTVRMDHRWDEQEFRELVEVSVRCLEEIADDSFFPRHVASFFGERLRLLEGMIRHPDFIAENRGQRTQEQAKQYFARRWDILRRLTSWMSLGGHPYSPEQLEPGD